MHPAPDAQPRRRSLAQVPLPLDRIGLFLGPAALAAWIIWVQPEPLSPPARRLAGIMLFTIIWWVTEPIPVAATGLAAVCLAVILGATPGDGRADGLRAVLASFADPSVFFLLGGLFIGAAMMRHGLDRRLALSVLCTRWAGRSPATILLGVGLAVGLISTCISNTAATAMMYPVTIGIITVLTQGGAGPGFSRSRYASALMLMTAYASSVGGVATPIGTATNVLAIGFFKRPEFFGQSADFLRWIMVGVPVAGLVFAGLFFWLRLNAPARDLDLAALRDYLRREQAALGGWKPGERATLAVFLLVVALWITPGILDLAGLDEARREFTRRFPEEIVALLAPVLLFLVPIDWKNKKGVLEAADFRHVDWGTVLLFGSGLALGGLMFRTGLAETAGQVLFDVIGTRDVWVVTALAIGGGILLSEFTSNAATAATLLPVIQPICAQAGVDSLPPLLGVTLAASFGSALPVSTPPNAIVYGSGLIPVRRMVAAGIGLDLIAGVVVWVVLRLAFAAGWTLFD